MGFNNLEILNRALGGNGFSIPNNKKHGERRGKKSFGKSKRLKKLAKLARKKQKRKEREYRNRIPKKYKIYIKSPFWVARKNAYYRSFGKKCAVCLSTKYIDLHHIVYGNYGFEKDEDLVPLCKHHHSSFHSKIGVKGNMTKETHEFIIEEQETAEMTEMIKRI